MERNKLDSLLGELDQLIPKHTSHKAAVSKVSIAWHLDHSLNVIISILEALKDSDPKTYKKTFSFYWLIMGSVGWFPRGKGKAPKVVRPEGEISEEGLRLKVQKARDHLSELKQLSDDVYFKHPYFGNLRKKQAVRFMIIHTQHHLKICSDILG